jgi:hypothetical protein
MLTTNFLFGKTVMAKANGSPKQFVNRTQAETEANKIGGKVFHPAISRVFYVELGDFVAAMQTQGQA